MILPAGPGVTHWGATYDVADVRHAVERAGRPFAHLDGRSIDSAARLHDALASELGFPSWYGANLDALADCLRDVRTDTVLLWDGAFRLAQTAPRVSAVAVELLGERLTLLVR